MHDVAWRGMWICVRSKDAQKQLARTSLSLAIVFCCLRRDYFLFLDTTSISFHVLVNRRVNNAIHRIYHHLKDGYNHGQKQFRHFPKKLFSFNALTRFQSNRPFAGSGHMVQNKLHWDANDAVGLSKQRNSYQSSPTFLCFESPTASFASQCNLFCTM